MFSRTLAKQCLVHPRIDARHTRIQQIDLPSLGVGESFPLKKMIVMEMEKKKKRKPRPTPSTRTQDHPFSALVIRCTAVESRRKRDERVKLYPVRYAVVHTYIVSQSHSSPPRVN